MRALFADLQGKSYRPGTFDCVVDHIGVCHVVRRSEAHLHNLRGFCICHAKIKNAIFDDGFTALVAIHRRLRHSRALFKPWERGH